MAMLLRTWGFVSALYGLGAIFAALALRSDPLLAVHGGIAFLIATVAMSSAGIIEAINKHK